MNGVSTFSPSFKTKTFIITVLQEKTLSSSKNHKVARLSWKHCMLWAACCLGYFGFMRSGEFTFQSKSSSGTISFSDLAIDSHSSPSLLCIKLRKAKTDPFGKGVDIYMAKTGTTLCPVSAILDYIALRPKGEGPLLLHADGSPLTRDQLVRMVKKTLHLAKIDASTYSGHSFRIRAAMVAAAADVPAHFIKMFGRWESEAYQLYVRTPHESLASISQLISR